MSEPEADQKCKTSAVVSSDDFSKAVCQGNVEDVRRLLEIDRSLVNEVVGTHSWSKAPSLVYVIKRHRSSGKSVSETLELVRVLLDHYDDINNNKCGKTALHCAVEEDLVFLVELLLQYQADVEVRDNNGRTPLISAKSVEVARLLIANGADVNTRNFQGQTLLRTCGNVGIPRLLLANGADVNIKDNDGNTSLSSACRVELARLLFAHGADANSKNSDGYPAWLLAIDIGDLETFKLLIEQGVDLQAAWGKEGFTSVHVAAGAIYGPNCETLEILEYLLDQGVDVNARTVNGKTPLHYAILENHESEFSRPLIQLLLQCGANINATDNNGDTAFASLSCGDANPAEVASLLIADVARDGRKVLRYAVSQPWPRISMVEFILQQGKVDLNARDLPDSDTLTFQMLDQVAYKGRANAE